MRRSEILRALLSERPAQRLAALEDLPREHRLPILASLRGRHRREFLDGLEEAQREALFAHWHMWARPEQLAPAGDWRVWAILAGRGFGKTRAGAEWVREVAETDPEARIALVGATLAEARAVMVEGESGLLTVCPPAQRPAWEPSLRRLTWPTGAQAVLFSAGEPEALRGPQHSLAWCDEVGKWDNASERALRAWDNLQLGLRLGDRPRLAVTTTPRAVPLVEKIMALPEDELAVTRGTMADNGANLPAAFLREMRRTFGHTRLGRQELDGELILDLPGALWTRATIETAREGVAPALVRVVVGVDPSASVGGDACGIIVAGIAADGVAHVLADLSLRHSRPERWARGVAEAAQTWAADRVVAEANQGGDMVESVLRAAGLDLPVRLVHARRGKAARAEPIATLYESGRVRHAGTFPALEDEMCGLMAGGRYEGPGRSPDRADALVWALTDLTAQRADPRVRIA